MEIDQKLWKNGQYSLISYFCCRNPTTFGVLFLYKFVPLEQVLYEFEFVEGPSRSPYGSLSYEHSRCGSKLAHSDAATADQGAGRAGQLAHSNASAADQGSRRSGQLAHSDAPTADQGTRPCSNLADSDAPTADQGSRRAGQLAHSDASAADKGTRPSCELAVYPYRGVQLA